MSVSKRVILTFTGGYVPGFKGGGPIRSIENLVEALGDEFNFMIITLDRDLDCNECYPGIKVNEWQKVGKADVFYISPNCLTLPHLCHVINEVEFDVLYLNSFFSFKFTIFPLVLRRIGLLKNKVTIVAPRGELWAGAMKIKALKKNIFIWFAKILKLYENVVWQASSLHDIENIKSAFKIRGNSSNTAPIIVAPNLSKAIQNDNGCSKRNKKPGSLNLVFLSRISPKKNLDGALKMMCGLSGKVTFNIFGPLEDLEDWNKCRCIIDTLPPNIKVNYKGAVRHDEVAGVLSKCELFLFPTYGENYGHVIIEALNAGCPILISDQTPWRGLENERVGWDFSLDHPEKFNAILQKCVDMDNREFGSLSCRAKLYGAKIATNMKSLEQNRELFNYQLICD